ncbi:MAG: hypothetical protein QF824_00355 [Candidatus Woesearchaeota archaeon]|jgi:hypothetical protein|nr:hypothetical protein [Candidatus Woesearchaeota archaeon]
MTPVQINEILKWVFIVFVAGFIGYFGRYLSKWVIGLFRGKKADSGTVVNHRDGDYKIEKKKLKLEKKRLKKVGK